MFTSLVSSSNSIRRDATEPACLCARKSAQSIFPQISEHACHSLFMPVKSFYEIFYREICKYFDGLCHSFSTALEITQKYLYETGRKPSRNFLPWNFSYGKVRKNFNKGNLNVSNWVEYASQKLACKSYQGGIMTFQYNMAYHLSVRQET